MAGSELKIAGRHGDRVRVQSWWRRSRNYFFEVLWVLRDRGIGFAAKRVLMRLRLSAPGYSSWIRDNDTLSSEDIALIGGHIERLRRRPRISLVLVLDDGGGVPRSLIASIQAQIYEKWELLIVVPAATERTCAIADYDAGDMRITIIGCGGDGFAEAANAGLSAATGDFVGFLEKGDELAPHALYLIAEAVNRNGEAALVYSDEDVLDGQGCRSNPHFKTAWNPDLFFSQGYLGRLALYRRDLAAQLGFRKSVEGCEEYDLVLRMIEKIRPALIEHIPFILVHRAKSHWDEQTDTVKESRRRALQEYFDRSGNGAYVEQIRDGHGHRVRWPLPPAPPRISIIIPTRDKLHYLRGAVSDLLGKTDYPDFEIIIIDNQSVEAETLSYFSEISDDPRVRVLHFDAAFNYSTINNFAARQCQSPLLAFLNNDVLVINPDWLREMVSHALRPEVGAVGAMLYYPNETIQHAGIVLGFAGVAANCYNGLARGADGYFGLAGFTQNYSAVTAACLVTRAAVFAEVGGFNEVDLPVAFNDVDYCLRLRERQYLVTWTPYAELYHLESVSRGKDLSPDKIARFTRERAYMIRRWSSVLCNDPYYSPNLSLDEKLFALAARSRVTRPWKALPIRS